VAASQIQAPLKETKPEDVTVSCVQSSSFTVYRREVKIVGMVDPESHKDRLSFVSLTRQVESGKSKGYTESEVIESVIRAICPTLKLRSYVETMEGLTLKKLLQILKAHYKQKSATELYHELTHIWNAHIWNSLPTEIRESNSIMSFETKIATYIFEYSHF
jgi:hypothetical protein